MALNAASNLSLGTLGHITAGNGNTTTQTSLAAGCRGATSSTSMWADFRIGSATVVKVSGILDGSDRGNFGIRVRNDVGTYMGGETLLQLYQTSVGPNTYYYQIEESGAGSLYQSRIAENSDNAADYSGEWAVTQGSQAFAIVQQSPEKDKFKFWDP